MLDRLCKRAKVRRITPHGLRRTFNDLGRRVCEKIVLQAITGHSTDRMTEHYSHVDHTEKRMAQASIIDLVKTAQKQASGGRR